MSAVNALAPTTQPSASATGFSALSATDFSKIIFTELSKQDPLQPNDTNALLQQISSVRAIQSDMDLTSKLDALVGQNEFASAATLIGKTVSGVDTNNDRVSGKVKSLSRASDGTYLTLATGQQIKVSNLDQIQDSAPAAPPATPPPPPHNTTPVNPATPTGSTPPTGNTPVGGAP